MNQDYRCGHNYFPTECPYPRCGYRELILEYKTKEGDLWWMRREIDRLKTENAKLRDWCEQMIEGLQYFLDDDAHRPHALGSLTDGKTGQPIPKLIDELSGSVATALEDAAK